jgi:hypothetical protein
MSLLTYASQIDLRPTKMGDLCVLLLSSNPLENLSLLQRQEELHLRCGGWAISTVHLTCQRFECPSGADLERAKRYLACVLADFPPFALYAEGVKMVPSVLRRSFILKWRTQSSPAIRTLIRQVRHSLEIAGMIPLYTVDFYPEMVSALESLRPFDMSVFKADEFPHMLFTASKMRVTRICEPNQFEWLGDITHIDSRINIRDKPHNPES